MPIDAPFFDIRDEDGLQREVAAAVALGFAALQPFVEPLTQYYAGRARSGFQPESIFVNLVDLEKGEYRFAIGVSPSLRRDPRGANKLRPQWHRHKGCWLSRPSASASYS